MPPIVPRIKEVVIRHLPPRATLWSGTLLLLIMLLALGTRIFTFWIPHWQGDQSQYVSLAMKLDQRGIKGYNLQEIGLRFHTFTNEPDLRLVSPTLLPKGEKGDLHLVYEMTGFQYYNMPFFYKAPLFPAVLAFSHKFLTWGNHPFIVAYSNLGWDTIKRRPKVYLISQYWAVIVPLLSSLLGILLTFILGRKFAGTASGLYAALLLTLHPTDIVSSNRLLTDDMAMFFMALSVWLFVHYYERRVFMGIFFSGMMVGFAVLTNQKSIFVLPTIGLYTLLTHADPFTGSPRRWIRMCFNGPILMYYFGACFVTWNWFSIVHSHYGNAFYQPHFGHFADSTGWFSLLEKRPPGLILYAVGIPFLCPPFIAFYFSFKQFMREMKASFKRRLKKPYVALMWLWAVPYIVFFWNESGKEHRYMLLAYPALAILAGMMLHRFHQWVSDYFAQPIYWHVVWGFLFVLSGYWSISYGWEIIFAEKFLLLRPF